jgi:serine/threonine protein kinase
MRLPLSRSMTSAASIILSRERRPGDRIEKYELIRPVANGGMGSVWAAKLHGPHGFVKVVAIKTVLPELAGDPRVCAMFLDEARLASAIVHRNVAHVLDFLEQETALYLVMEWVDGISLMALHERLAALGGRVPIGIVLRVLADACAGLHAAHELTYTNGEPCGLVHRDVSPHNVLVATEGSAKLIDFGVAKTRFRMAPESTLGHLRGRLAFMAPEQAQTAPLDRRADIWSVGASLFYLLAGFGPYGPCERTETLRRILTGASTLAPPPDTHPAVARILAGCLPRRPEDRFPTAEHLGWAIEETIEEMRLSATAKDVAEFVADRAERADPRETGRLAVPRELTLLRPDTVSSVRPKRQRGEVRVSPPNVRRAVVALAVVSIFGASIVRAIGSAATTPRVTPPSPASLATAEEGLAPSAPLAFADPPAAPLAGQARTAEPAGPATAIVSHDAWEPERPAHPHRRHPVRFTPLNPAASKAKTNHGQSGGAQ